MTSARRHIWTLPWAAMVLASGLFVAHAQQVLDEAAQRQLADGLYSRGMFELAAAEYESFLSLHPDSADVHVCRFRMGECYRNLGNVAKAEAAYRKLFTENSESEFRFKAGFQRANIFLMAKRPQSAVELFDLLLSKNPPPEVASAALYFKGEACLELGQQEQARAAFQELVKTHMSTEYYAYALLKLSALLGAGAENSDPKQAIQLLELARQSARTDRIRAETLFQLAERHFELKDYTQSAPLYQSLLKQYPDDERSAQARLRAAWASHNAGLYADALVMATANQDAERVPDWLYLQANCERQLARPQDAVVTYRRLLSTFAEGPVADAARYELALTYYRIKDYANALETAATLTGEAAAARETLWLQGESCAALGRRDDAIQYYRLLIRDYPDSETACDANYRVAYQLQVRENLLEASRFYMQVAEKCPQYRLADQALYAAGHCLAACGKHADAVAAWSALLKDYGTSAYVEESTYRKGMSEIHLERNDAALVTLRALLKDQPATSFLADAQYWIGMLLLKADKLHDAETAFAACIDAKPRDELQREAQYQRAVTLHLQKKFDESAALLQPLLQTPVRDRLTPSFLEWLCMYRLDRKQIEEALAAATLLSEFEADPARHQLGLCLVGRCHIAAGRMQDAATAYRKALAVREATPLAIEAALALGNHSLQSNDAAAAVTMFTKSAGWSQSSQAQGSRARSYLGLGRAHKALGNLDEAARFFMSVAVLYDDADTVPECLFSSAEIYASLGQVDNAKTTMNELRERYPESDWAKRSQQETTTP